MSSRGLETRLSINPFSDRSGSIFVLVNDDKPTETMGGRK